MAATYRSSTSANTASTPASSLALTIPSGVQPNDNLLVSIAVDGGSGATVTPPTGWTQISTAENAGTSVQNTAYWRLATGQEAASYTWTFDSARQAAGVMAAYSGGSLFVPGNTVAIQSTTPSTSVSLASIQQSGGGMTVEFHATRNTTGTSTLTPAGSYANRADSCTTASPFIEACIEDVSVAFSLGGNPATPPTASQSVTTATRAAFLESYHLAVNTTVNTPLVIDTYGGATSRTTSVTIWSASNTTLATHYNNELVVLLITINKDNQTVSSISGGGLTWSLATRANAGTGSSEIWYAFAATPTAPFTPTITFNGSVVSAGAAGLAMIGVDTTASNGSGAIGATATALSSSAAPTVNLTTTRNGSWIFACANDPSASTAWTAGSNQTLMRSNTDATNSCGGGTLQQTNPTAVKGNVITSNFTAPSANSCNIAAIEIVPAISHGLSAAKAGA